MTPLVQTVFGPVPSDKLGRVLPHEHLLSLVPGPWLASRLEVHPGAIDLDREHRAVEATIGLVELGYGCIVDLSPYGLAGRADHGESIESFARIADATGLHIVVGTSTYLEAFSPAWARDASVDELTRRFVADIEVGIGDSSCRAGVLGEQATGLGQVTDFEERGLRAAVRASNATGVALMTHTTHSTMAERQIEIILEEGGDPRRVVIGHMDIADDVEALIQVLDSGVSIAFDTIGKQRWDFFLSPLPPDLAEGEFAKQSFHRSDRTRATMLVDLVERGYSEQILLSHDLTGAEVYLNAETHGLHGYRYLDDVFIPMCLDLGLPEPAIDQLTRGNPARLLSKLV